MKQYIAKHVDRPIPVGYSAADVAENRMQQAHYFNCGDDADARADFYGVNDYSWCGQSSFAESSYREKVQNFTDYSIPIFLSEYGCNTQGPRPFTEIEAIYGPEMTPVFSGGLVYEYSMDTNKYGLVQLESLDAEDVEKLGDFDTLKDQFEAYPLPEDDGDYKENNQPSECPPRTELWEASNDLPSIPSKSRQLLENGAAEPKGWDTETNQWTPDSGAPPPEDEPSETDEGTDEETPAESSPAAAPGSRYENAVAGMWVAGVLVLASGFGAMLL